MILIAQLIHILVLTAELAGVALLCVAGCYLLLGAYYIVISPVFLAGWIIGQIKQRRVKVY